MKSKKAQPSSQTSSGTSPEGTAPAVAAGMPFAQGQALTSPRDSGPASSASLNGKLMLKRGNKGGSGPRGNAKATFGTATAGGGGKVPHKDAMEQAFGQSFDSVQAFTGKKDAMASLGANAAQHGEKVAFADSSPSKELVAHELAHVVQARGGDTGSGDLSKPGDRQEVQADQVAAAVMQGNSAGAAGLGAASQGQAAEQGPVHGSFLGDVFESTKSNLLGMDTAVDAKRWFETSVLYRASWLTNSNRTNERHICVVINDNRDWRERWLPAAGPVVANQSRQLMLLMQELLNKADDYNELSGRTRSIMRNVDSDLADQAEDEGQARPQVDIADMTMLRAELKNCNSALRHQRSSFQDFSARAEAFGLDRLGDGFADKADTLLGRSQSVRRQLVAAMEQQGASLDSINAASSQDLAHAGDGMRKMGRIGSNLDDWWLQGDALIYNLRAYLADSDVQVDRETRRHYEGLIAAVSGVNARIESFDPYIRNRDEGLMDRAYSLLEQGDTDNIEGLTRVLAETRSFKTELGGLRRLLQRYSREYERPHDPFGALARLAGAAHGIIQGQ